MIINLIIAHKHHHSELIHLNSHRIMNSKMEEAPYRNKSISKNANQISSRKRSIIKNKFDEYL